MADTVTSTLDDSGPGTSTGTGDIGEVAAPTITPYRPPAPAVPKPAPTEAPPTVDRIDPKTGLPVFTLSTPSKPAEPPPDMPQFVLSGSEPKGWQATHQQPNKEMPSEAGERPPPPQYEDLPTIADLPIDSLPRTPGASDWYDPDLARRQRNIAFGPAMAETVEGKQNILKENLPGATFETDRFGNPLVVYEGKKYHISRPDSFNKQDVGEAVLQAAPTAALSTLALATGPVGWIIGASEMAAAGYLGNQFRAWAGRQAGSGEQVDPTSSSAVLETIINAFTPVAGKVASLLGKRSVGAMEHAPGVQRVLVTKEAAEEALNKVHPDDLYFHTNTANAVELARRLPFTDVTRKLEARAVQHAEAAPTRIAKSIDEAVGPVNPSIKEAIEKAKGPASKELTEAFAQSGPINIAPMMAELDKAIADAGNTPAGKAMQKLRSMLVEQEGRTASAGAGQWVDSPIAGQPAMWRATAGQQGAEIRYASDAQKLNTIKREFDRMIKWGDDAAGVAPQAISNTDHAIGNVRQRLSGLLNDNVKGYGEIMQKYQSAYDMEDAFLMGQKIMAGGNKTLKLENVMPFLQGNPAERQGFEMGVRDAIDRVVRTAPMNKETGAVEKVLSGENSHRREILNEMFGKDKLALLEQMAEREGNYAVKNQMIVDAVEQGRAVHGATRAAKVDEGVVPKVPGYTTATALAINAGSAILGKIGAFLAGSKGRGFERRLADTLTAPAGPVLEAIREGARPAVNQIGAITSPAVPPAMAELHRQQQRDKLPRAAGGRTKYRFDCASRASKLCREAELIRKRHAGETKHLLNSSDDEVADALRVASRGL